MGPGTLSELFTSPFLLTWTTPPRHAFQSDFFNNCTLLAPPTPTLTTRLQVDFRPLPTPPES